MITMKKGLSPLIEALLLVVMSISLSVIIAAWLPSISTEKTSTIAAGASEDLKCQSGHIYIKSASYNCSNNCAAGTAHTATVNIVNSGRIQILISKMYIQNITGETFLLNLSETATIEPAVTKTLINVSTNSCTGINNTIDKITVSSVNCPNTASDSIRGSDITYISC